MRKITKTVLSLLLCMTVTLSMCMVFADDSYAEAEGDTLMAALAADVEAAAEGADAETTMGTKEAGVLHAAADPYVPFDENDYLNNKINIDDYIITGFTKGDYTVPIRMPSNGTLSIQIGSDDGASYNTPYVSGCGAQYGGKIEFNNSIAYMYTCSSAGTVTADFSVYSGEAWFVAYYAPVNKTLSANTAGYVLGSVNTNAYSNFYVNVPSTGYLNVRAANGVNSSSSGVYVMTSGFQGAEYRKNGMPVAIGVTKGTYTISLKGAPIYDVVLSFTPVKETSAKTSKKKAAKIKKKKENKGIIVVNNKKVHWYKIKNTKNQKMTIAVDARNISGGSSSALKITMYFPKGKKQSAICRTGTNNEFKVRSGRVGTKKAQKGTYYIKIQSNSGGNGYYTLKWK